MNNHDFYASAVKGKIAEADFSSFLPTNECPSPVGKIVDYLVSGPFVTATDGAFETEYFYERDKILAVDYLEDAGGESGVVPYEGATFQNRFLGKAVQGWAIKSSKGSLELARVDEGYASELFLTEQRNIVYYAASYINCESDCDAVICYENSGSRLFVNGELVDCRPYGRVKGMSTAGYAAAVSFRKGRNLLMFKIRGGYIADGMDVTIVHTTIYPVAIKSNGLGITYPKPVFAHIGNREKPRQLLQAFAGAFDGNTEAADIFCGSEKLSVPALSLHRCSVLRPSIEVAADGTLSKGEFRFEDSAACEFKVQTQMPLEYDGVQHLFSDFHFDTTYHQEQRTYALGAFYITSKMIDKLGRDERFKAILSEVDYLHPYYSIYPKDRSVLRSAFLNGRAEADCFYNQPNELTSSPEGFVRNLVYGQLYHRDVLGRLSPVYAPGDVFGHPNQMSQICSKGGCIAARWGKVVWGLDEAFIHVSPDGTTMLHDKDISDASAQRLGIKHCHWYRQNGTVASCPSDEDLAWTEQTVSKTRFSVFSDMLSGMLKDIEEQKSTETGVLTDMTSRDLTQHHSGVLLTRTDFKQANRLAENLLITAEKFSALAAIYGAKYPEKALDKAWRQLICAQHHDSITGTNNEISFVDLMIEYREACELAADIVRRSTSFLASGIKLPGEGLPYVVFNPHAWERTEPCTIEIPESMRDLSLAMFSPDGHEYPLSGLQNGKACFVPCVPALGYCVFVLREAVGKTLPQNGRDYTIENDYFRLTVDPKLGGGIVSIYDKLEKREVVNSGNNGPANRVVVLREVHDRMEEQHEIYTTGHKLCSDEFEAEVAVERTPSFQRITTCVQLDIVARVRQQITLWDNVQRIDMKTVVEDYQGEDDLFTLTFPVNVAGAKPVYDDRFAPHVCSTGRKKLSFQTHQYASFSHSRIAPVNQWLDLGPTLSAKLYKGRLPLGRFNVGMTALIRANRPELVRAGEKLITALSKKAIPVTPYPDVEQHGGHKIIHFNEDLDNTDTRFVLSVKGIENEYEKKLVGRLNGAQWMAFLDRCVQDGRAALYFRDSNNIYKKPIDVVLLKANTVEELNKWIDEIAMATARGREFRIDNAVAYAELPKIDDYGVAIFNNGTIAASVEPDNMLNMMLFHTANFYGNKGKTTGGAQLVPEQKTHSFSYALCPHSGSYREAKLYRRALEFNDPLFAVAPVEQREPVLEQKHSFVECDSGFVLTSFKAGGYPMASMKANHGSIEQRGLALRGFEPNGIDEQTELEFGFDFGGVSRVNLLEENAESLECTEFGFTDTVGAHSIETYALTLTEPNGKIGTAVLGAEKEEVEPTFVRSWEHDLGSMPMGYLGIAGTIGKNIEHLSSTEIILPVNMVNNYIDSAVSGTMKLLVPNGFTADKTDFEYSLEAGGSVTYPVKITKETESTQGVFRLEYEHDGQRFEDVFEFGFFDPQLSLEIGDGKISVTVFNNTASALSGELALATPFETWSLGGFNRESTGSISQRTLPVVLNAGERKTFEFDYSFADDGIVNAFWAVAKLMMNGRIHFAHGARRGARHNHWAHVLHGILRNEDNGSIERILKM